MLRYFVACMMFCAAPAWAAEDKPLSDMTPRSLIICKTKEAALQYIEARETEPDEMQALEAAAVSNKAHCQRLIVFMDDKEVVAAGTYDGVMRTYRIASVTLLGYSDSTGLRRFVHPASYFVVVSKPLAKV